MTVSESHLQKEGADSRSFGPFSCQTSFRRKLILNREAMKFATGAAAGFRLLLSCAASCHLLPSERKNSFFARSCRPLVVGGQHLFVHTFHHISESSIPSPTTRGQQAALMLAPVLTACGDAKAAAFHRQILPTGSRRRCERLRSASTARLQPTNSGSIIVSIVMVINI